jgi:hypothetical protein
MKAIMAEAESNKPAESKAPAFMSRTTGLERITQRERRKMQLPASDTFEKTNNPPAESTRPTSSPWKVTTTSSIGQITTPLPSASAVATTQLGTLPSGPSRGKLVEPKMPITPPVTPMPPGTPPRISQSSLGPIFVPSRQSPTKAVPSSSRHASYVDSNL